MGPFGCDWEQRNANSRLLAFGIGIIIKFYVPIFLCLSKTKSDIWVQKLRGELKRFCGNIVRLLSFVVNR